MPMDSDDDYFPSPSTPSRQTRLKSPERSHEFGSGSVSSLVDSPPKVRRSSLHDGHEDVDYPESDPSTPAVEALRKASGFASVRVGLGSPKWTMKRTLTSGRSGEGEQSQGSGLPETSMRGKGMVNIDSGLPTPPGTNSDIGRPPPMFERTESQASRQTVVPNQNSPPRPPRHPRRPSSQYLPDLPDPDSPGPSSRTSSPHLRSRGSYRGGSPSISQSSSSSSGFALGTLREGIAQYSPEGSQTIRGNAYSDRYRPDRRASVDADRRETLASPSPAQSRSGSVSPRKAHQRSPSLPSDAAPRRPTYRPRHSEDNRRGREIIQEESADDQPQVRSPVGTSLDDRIREAEEKIKRTNDRRPRTAGHETTLPISGEPRRHESYIRAAHSPSTNSTLQRSATLSSASVMTPNGVNGSDSSRRPGVVARLSGEDVHERENSGGSGSSGRRKPIPRDFRNGGLFTPPKPVLNTITSGLPTSRSYSRLDNVPRPSSSRKDDSPSSRFATASRLQTGGQYHETSPIDRFRPPRHTETRQSPRAESSFGHRGDDGGTSRWQASGLPRDSGQEHRRQYDSTTIRRADSVLGTANDRHRYERRGGSVESALMTEKQKSLYGPGRSTRISPRYALSPGDSVSVVGGKPREAPDSTRKDPRDLLKRMEEMRAQHRETWEAERSASVIGEHALPRSSSKLFDPTPRHARPSTSMSAIRDSYEPPVPRTAPVESGRARRDQVMAADSPLVGRGTSRLGHQPKPATEPRPMRASTSMGGRMATSSLDFAVPNTEHGRLLFEACRALEFKIGADVLVHVPDMIKTIQSAARTAEHVNASLRNALDQVNSASVGLDMGDLDKSRRDLERMEASVRDASRTSDQNVRELTRVMLDLPKLLRQAERVGAPRTGNRTSSPSQYDQSPVRSSYEMMRPSTSLGEIASPTYRYSLESRRPILQPRTQPPGERNSAVSNLVAKMKGLTPKRSPLPQQTDLQTIEQSPPNQTTNRVPSVQSSKSRSSLALSTSPTKSSRSSDTPPNPPPRSPERRKVLRKKASTTSTHTVRGSSAFMPSSSKVQTTTALSVVNHDFEHEAELTPAKSIRSARTFSTNGNGSDEYASSPASGFSFAQAQEHRPVRSSMESYESSSDGRTRPDDAVSFLEHSLAAAAKKREGEDERKPSVSERFRATLRRGPSVRAKE